MKVMTTFIVEAKFRWTFQILKSGQMWLACLGFSSLNVMLVTLASLVTVSIGPKAAGSGIPECMGFLNGINLYEWLSVPTLFSKVFGLVLG